MRCRRNIAALSLSIAQRCAKEGAGYAFVMWWRKNTPDEETIFV